MGGDESLESLVQLRVVLQNVCCLLGSIFLPNIGLDKAKMHIIFF